MRAPRDLLRRLRFERPVPVTRPALPSLDAYRDELTRAWESGWLTNDGAIHRELETRLAEHLGVRHLSLCCNGTVALLIALQAAGVQGGEVVTTPFTFPATPHALHWNRVTPVFCDIEERTFNLDPERLEALIGPDTRAILPVHVFGNPCDVEAIGSIASRHGFPVIYDAAHAMAVRLGDRSLLDWGDLSVLSFHATKLFTTGEGGAIVSGSPEQWKQIYFLRNFGIADEETVTGPGINGKLSELQAALGLLALDLLDGEIAARRVLTAAYRDGLRDVPGVVCQEDLPGVTHNYAYFAVLVDPDAYGLDRDDLNELLREFNVFPRKYFHPLASEYPPYASLPSAAAGRLPVAERVGKRVLCLPLFGTLERDAVERICAIVAALHEQA